MPKGKKSSSTDSQSDNDSLILYSNKDLVLLEERISTLEEKLDERKLRELEPTLDEQMDVANIVFKYVKDNIRKIYGGTALNEIIKHNDPKDAFYVEGALPDIDFYSPNPIVDGIHIANILQNAGYTHILASQAVHGETYKVKCKFVDAADISYVPAHIYNMIPTLEINGISMVHPEFVMLDMYRILSEPMFSARRWMKIIPRLFLIQKHYPLKKSTEQLPLLEHEKANYGEERLLVLNYIKELLTNHKKFIVVGDYAYNHFLLASGLHEDSNKESNKESKFRYLGESFYHIVSTNYHVDGYNFITKLKDKFGEDISIREHHPFWQYIGDSAFVFYKKKVVAFISDYMRRCTPIKRVVPHSFVDGKIIKGNNKDFIQIGSFDFVFLHSMIMKFFMKCLYNEEIVTHYGLDEEKAQSRISCSDCHVCNTTTAGADLAYANKMDEEAKEHAKEDALCRQMGRECTIKGNETRRLNNRIRDFYDVMSRQLLEMRNHFFSSNPELNIFDDTLFEEYLIDCIGHTMDPRVESGIARKEKLMEGKPPSWLYDPDMNRKENPETNYRFANTSGRRIGNISCYNLTKENAELHKNKASNR